MHLTPLALAATAAALATGVRAAPTPPEAPAVALTLKDHRFTPDQITVPAGQKVLIELTNKDAATEEFDSDDLRVEKDVTPHGKVSFTVGPLQPGTYSFQGELHADTAQGRITAVTGPAATSTGR